MNMRKIRWIITAMVLILLSAIAPASGGRVAGQELDKVAAKVADTLDANLLYTLDRTAPILYTSFVELSRLNTTSRLGMLLGDQVASRFSQHGHRLIELKLMKNAIVMKQNTGEFALSRDSRRIMDMHDAQAVLVGTYTLSGDRIFISARLVGAEDNIILSACYFSYRLDKDLLALADHMTASETGGMEKANAEKPANLEMRPLASGMILLDPRKPTDAKLIQIRLAKLEYYEYKIDGMWGKRSRAALARFKKDRGLSGGGRFDMDTQKMLFQ